MILGIAKMADFDKFLETFSTKGAAKRKEFGSKGARVYRDPEDPNRALIVFDWDEEGYQSLLTDPDMPAIFQEAGLQGPPQKAELAGEYDS